MSAITNSSLSKSPMNSVYLVNNCKMVENFQNNPKLCNLIQKTCDKEIAYNINDRKVSLVEIELNIEAIEFIEKVQNEGYSDVRLVSSQFMRVICLRNLDELTPLIDIYFALKNLTQEIKKIILVADPCVVGLNKNICFVEYNSHPYAKKALSVMKALGSSNSSYSNRFLSILSNEKSIDAVWCEPLVDNIKEILKKTPFAYFENLLINNYNLFHFKQFLEKKLKNEGYSTFSILQIRQFSNRILVRFNQLIPPFLFESPFFYEGSLIHVLPAMRPNINLGKYKEKTFKASIHFLNDEDKKLISSIFADENYLNDYIKTNAEVQYAKIMIEEKKEKLKEKEREREKNEKEKEKEKEKDREREKDRDREMPSNLKYKRERTKEDLITQSKERRKDKNEKEKNEDVSNKIIPSVASIQSPMNNNYLSQISNLLMTNPNSNILSNLQNLSVLGNLQNILANPSLVSMLQNLVGQNTNPQTNILNPLNPPTSNKIINPAVQQNTPGNVPSNFSSSQINPIYNLPKSVDNVYYQNSNNYPQKTFYTPASTTQQYPFPITPDMYINQMQYNSNNIPMSSLNMQPEYSLNHNSQDLEIDNHLMKKYYEYFQQMK